MTSALIDRLFVLWRAPADGARHVVGHLTRRPGEAFRFWYADDVSGALAQGFSWFPTFPEHRTESAPYEARYLWTTFADRIPSPHRPDAKQILATWGVANSDDPFDVLARSGGLRATDRIELAEHRASDDMLTSPLEFRVAGGRHVPLGHRARLATGDELLLRREPDNPRDPAASLVLSRNDQRAGYVPRQYSALVARLLDQNVTLAVVAVRELSVPDEVDRWVVRASRA